VRNHALDPLSTQGFENVTETDQPTSLKQFDRLLFLNDVVFSPKDAADLLFATNAGPDGIADYHAACAMDFINPIKFYDRFAMRDNEAYRVGVPFFPWFARAGKAESFNAVMRESDAVPVKSCWGGMVAFEAKWFQKEHIKEDLEPLRFRAEPDIFWDASECCLIHADLQELVQQSDPDRTANAKIFANPFIRVAYDSTSHRWLEFTRKFERLYTIPHLLISWLLGMPWYATRITDIAGRQVRHLEWIYTGPIGDDPKSTKQATIADIPLYGHWEVMRRTAKPGGFCGYDFLLALKTKWEPGEQMWEKIFAPPGDHGDSKFT
jgi:Cryptococcal mannosyltransferase 1